MRQFRLAGLAITLLLAARCGVRPAPRNVVIISIDTLRPDHLGCYGYPRETSPHLDAFCQESIVFTQAVAHAPSTLPSHASMFTSLLPSHHGASVANSSGLSDEAVTLAEILKAEGYRTAAFTGGIQLDPIFGLDRGFDVYTAARPSVASAEVLRDPVDRFDHVVDQAIEWLSDGGGGDEPVFLFLHSYETHHPYTPDPSTLALFETGYTGELPSDVTVDLLQAINRGDVAIDENDRTHIVATYDAEIRSVDDALGRLLDFLRFEGLYEDTVVMFTSDHGEEFGEHGIMGWHAHTLYDELLRVPLVVKLPNGRGAGRVIGEQVRGIDLAPTILEEVGVALTTAFEGASVLSLVEAEGRGRTPPRPSVARADVVLDDDVPSLRTPEWKWIRGQLFHLASDPGETVDVAAQNPEIAAAMQEQLRALVGAAPAAKPRPVTPDQELLDKLRALGYLR